MKLRAKYVSPTLSAAGKRLGAGSSLLLILVIILTLQVSNGAVCFANPQAEDTVVPSDLPALDSEQKTNDYFSEQNQTFATPSIEGAEFENAPIDIQRAVDLAVNNDPRFQQINWQIEQAKGERLQATRYPNPSSGIVANEVGNNAAGGQYGVFWSQSVVRNNRQSIQHRYFSIAIAALQQQYEIRRWQIARNIGKRFLKASRFKEEQSITKEQIESLKEILDITTNLFEAGEISQIAVSNIQLELEALKQKLVELDLKRDYETRALAIPLGMTDMANNTPQSLQIQFDWNSIVSELMNAGATAFDPAWMAIHPEVNFANAEVRQSRSKIELARSERCPDVQVQGNLNYDTETDSVFAGFQIGAPVLKYDRKTGAIAAATAEFQAKAEGVRLIEMRLQSSYTIGEGEIARLRSRVTNVREVIIPRSLKNLRQVREAFEIGEAEFLLLKTGLEQVLQSRIQLLDAEFELAIASVELKTLLSDD